MGLWLTVVLGVLFTCVQAYEYSHAAFGFKGNIYGATFFMATGFHGAHVIIGTIFLAVCLCRVYLRPLHADRSISASSSPPGTGTSSTWSGCSCSPRSTSGAAAATPPRRTDARRRSEHYMKGGRRAALRCSARRSRPHPLGPGAKPSCRTHAPLPRARSRALRGRCPRCGEGRLFEGFLALRPPARPAASTTRFADSADGPAFFVMSIVGIVVVGLALWVEFAYEPPIWLHLVLVVAARRSSSASPWCGRSRA